MEEVAKQIYVESEYDGVNVGAMVTPTGVICIDAPSYARDARDWAARMHRLSPYPVQQIILTDSHGDRILNTRWLNAPIVMHHAAAQQISAFDKKFPQQLLDSLTQRNPHRGRELSSTPVESAATQFDGEIVMFRHNQQIVLRAIPGPAIGNCWVLLPDRRVLFAGDTLVVDTQPLLSQPHSAAWLQTLAQLRELSKEYTLVPGRGPVLRVGSAEALTAIDALSDYLTAMRERVQAHLATSRSRDGLVTYIPEFLDRYPSSRLPADWVRQQVKANLHCVFDELKTSAPRKSKTAATG